MRLNWQCSDRQQMLFNNFTHIHLKVQSTQKVRRTPGRLKLNMAHLKGANVARSKNFAHNGPKCAFLHATTASKKKLF